MSMNIDWQSLDGFDHLVFKVVSVDRNSQLVDRSLGTGTKTLTTEAWGQAQKP